MGAVKEVILVGDQRTAEEVVKAPPKVRERCVGFSSVLKDALATAKSLFLILT